MRFIERRAVDPALKGLGLPAREDQTELSPQQRADLLSIAESKDKKWNKTIKNGLMFGIGACLLGIFGWLFKKIFLNPQKA
jgi:hypothetical protein